MDLISKVKISDTSYEIKDGTARLAIVTLNNELNVKADKATTLSGYGITDAINTSSTALTKAGNLTAAKFITNNGTSSQFVKGDGSLDTHSYIPYGGVLMPTNPFGGQTLYINSIDNAFASADKKYYVTVTKHSKVAGGVTYPYTDSTKDSTDDNYFVDGPVISNYTSTSHRLFNGSYEDNLTCGANEYIKVRIMFGENTSPSESTSCFRGYPYGTFYISYYYNLTPNVSSQYRVYNKYAAHGIGWHLYTASAFNGSLNNPSFIEKIEDQGNYSRSCVEFIIYGNDTSGRSVGVTQIDYKLFRPALARDGSTVTKYDSQSLYFPFEWYDNYVRTVSINNNGDITAEKYIKSGGTSSQFLKADGSVDETSYGTYSKPSMGIPKTDLASAVQTSLGKADTALQSFTETDPTVPAWAKSSTKPTYTASEVGALPDSTVIPNSVSDLTQDVNYAGSTSVAGTANKTASIPYGEVDSTSTDTAYTATVDGITELRDGICMLLKNGVVTSKSGFTININNLGAKPCYNNLATGNDVTPTNPTRDTTIFNINYTMLFVYSSTIVDGGGWICYRGYDSNTNTIGYQIRRNNGTYTAYQAVSLYKILFSYSPTQMLAPTTSTGTGTSKTVTTYDFDPFGAIFVYIASATVANGSAIAIASMWEQYTVDLRYSFNCGTITNNKDVYVKCSPQSNGRVKFAGTNPIVLTLPTTEDGYVYIHLGHMYSTSSMVLALHHPVYYYKDGAIRLWSNAEPIPTTVASLSDASTYANKIESISVNGVALTITNKNVDIAISSSNDPQELLNGGYQEITYAELKALRDNSQLIPGKYYRIIDYVTTALIDIVGEICVSGCNRFDIIVLAIDYNRLSEDASAALHEQDIYFSNNNLSRWKLKYSVDALDDFSWVLKKSKSFKAMIVLFDKDDYCLYILPSTNGPWFLSGSTDGITTKVSDYIMVDPVYYYTEDTTFTANYDAINIGDTITDSKNETGKIIDKGEIIYDYRGIIYYMKDEYNNECNYDFKNILFKGSSIMGNSDVITDDYIDPNVFYHTFSHMHSSGYSHDISVLGVATDNNFALEFDGDLPFNICVVNAGKANRVAIYSNKISDWCCHCVIEITSSSGHAYYNNIDSGSCMVVLSNKPYYNNILNESRNVVVKGHDNIVSFSHNVVSDINCISNIIYDCYNLKFGTDCTDNIITHCKNITFGTSEGVKNYYKNIIIEPGNQYIYLNNTQTTSNSNLCQNIKICSGVNNTTTWKLIDVDVVGNQYLIEYKNANSRVITV